MIVPRERDSVGKGTSYLGRPTSRQIYICKRLAIQELDALLSGNKRQRPFACGRNTVASAATLSASPLSNLKLHLGSATARERGLIRAVAGRVDVPTQMARLSLQMSVVFLATRVAPVQTSVECPNFSCSKTAHAVGLRLSENFSRSSPDCYIRTQRRVKGFQKGPDSALLQTKFKRTRALDSMWEVEATGLRNACDCEAGDSTVFALVAQGQDSVLYLALDLGWVIATVEQTNNLKQAKPKPEIETTALLYPVAHHYRYSLPLLQVLAEGDGFLSLKVVTFMFCSSRNREIGPCSLLGGHETTNTQPQVLPEDFEASTLLNRLSNFSPPGLFLGYDRSMAQQSTVPSIVLLTRVFSVNHLQLRAAECREKEGRTRWYQDPIPGVFSAHLGHLAFQRHSIVIQLDDPAAIALSGVPQDPSRSKD
ncbi:hypothetical protein NM208_g11596 [Fusarium decemcellulare]|uniref:Uncharacterized protein n=1 Tax=Fusarium decemcellulare TaxID=57161 RepID=A0ACC1RU60_9HYPO|nr:hypothetical protein NM208_g11596 [Fusarium decemcellulare]